MDNELEQQINRIISKPNNLGLPDPVVENNQWGHKSHKCPECGQYCPIRGGGYSKHYVAKHYPTLTRQKAKAIIKAVRNYDKKMRRAA